MLMVSEPPKAITRYHEIGGVLDFAFFADTDGREEDLYSAVGQSIERAKGGWREPPRHAVNPARLLALAGRELNVDEFPGSKVDSRTGDIRCNGQYRMTNGHTVVDPSYRQLGQLKREGVTILAGGSVTSADGRFGQAFAYQPYPLRGDPERIRKTFDAVCALILPPGKRCRILDWSGPRLDNLSSYFQSDHAYWGEYLFTVHVEEDQWLTVIAGSASD